MSKGNSPAKKRTPKTKNKKSIKQKCPHCNQWFADVSKHIAKKHVDKTDENSDDVFSEFQYVDPFRAKDPLGLIRFIEWRAMPSHERSPKTQNELADELEISKNTLTRWSRIEGFWKEVEIRQKRDVFEKEAADVLWGLTMRAKTGDPRAVRTFLEYIRDWSPKLRTEDETPREPTDEEARQVDEVLRRWGLVKQDETNGQVSDKSSGA